MRIRTRPDFRRFARDGVLHQGLRDGGEFFVIEIDDMNYRVVDADGEPILYPKELFQVLDTSIPSHWHFREYPDGEYRLSPRCVVRGFYEAWFNSDGDIAARDSAQRALRDELERAMTCAGPEHTRLIEEALARLRIRGTNAALPA